MRCKACDVQLNDFEATRKDEHGNYIDFCNQCFKFIDEDVPSVVRYDLFHDSFEAEDEQD